MFADADLEAAIDGALFAAFANQGEVCSAGSRLLVQREIHKPLVQGMLKKIPKIKIGHGLGAGVKMGPSSRPRIARKSRATSRSGKEEGATLACGGKRPDGKEFEQRKLP